MNNFILDDVKKRIALISDFVTDSYNGESWDSSCEKS